MKHLLSILIILCIAGNVYAQWDAPYFPTGMSWQERVLDFNSGEPEWGVVETFEIGTDTIINGLTYKQVRRDGQLEPIWVREQGNIVWLLTNASPNELKLYDFNWDSQQEITLDYFKINVNDGSHQLCTKKFNTNNVATTFLNGTKVQYYREYISRTTIRGIGDVIDLPRFGCIHYPHDCLLGYCEPEVVWPGVCFKKVIRIQRNGVEIYSSDNSDDWINVIPNSVHLPRERSINSQWYNLSGHQLSSPPTRKGVYIRGGKKVLIK